MPDNACELLKKLISINTANPPGNEEQICRYIQALLKEWGLSSSLFSLAPGRTSLFCQIEGRERGSVVLTGHLDTVEPAEGWLSDPFHAQERSSRIYGLGASDMKAGVALLLQCAKEIKAKGKPRLSLKILLTADEENQYRGAASFAEAGFLDDALFVLEAEPTGGEILFGEKAELWISLKFSGKEAHGSIPGEGVNAILACSHFLLSLAEKVRNAPPRPYFGSPSLNIGRIEGGRRINIVPDFCRADLDFRLGAEEEKDWVMHLLNQRATEREGANMSCDIISYKRPLLSDFNSGMVQSFCRAFERETKRNMALRTATFCTDLPTLFPQHLPPFAIYGPGDVRLAHQPNESVEISSIKESMSVIMAFLEEVLG